MSAALEQVQKLWGLTPEKTRLKFSRHPVDEVRLLEAEVERLRGRVQYLEHELGIRAALGEEA